MNRSDFLKTMAGGVLGMLFLNGTTPNRADAANRQFVVDCLGDSTTWGADGIGKSDGPAISWPEHLKRITGWQDVQNIGKKGSRFAVTSERKDSFVERVSKVRADSDLVLVLGGVNDFQHSVPLGEIQNGDTSTFYGAVEYVLTTLLAQHPSGELIFMTPMKADFRHPTKNYPNSFERNSAGLLQEDYVAAIKTVCAHYSVPVIDLFNESGISPFFEPQRKLYMPDGLHYNKQGYERLAKHIASQIKRFIG